MRKMSRRPRRLSFAVLSLVVLGVAGSILLNAWSDSDRLVPTPVPSGSLAASSPSISLSTVEGPSVPAHGAYAGAWVYPRPFSQAGRVTSFTSFETILGRRLQIVHLYRRWGEPVGTASDLAFARSGRYLLISWPSVDTRRVSSGAEDAVVTRTARQIAALPTKVFLEFRWEMDRPNLQDVVHGPKDYIAAWNHVRRLFAQQHVMNVAWVWCPTAGGFQNGTAQAYYPGDGAVDWTCADVYPLTPWKLNDYEPFPALVKAFMTWAAQHPKPVIIGELAVGTSYGRRRANWIRGAGAYVAAHPQIKAFAWFETTVPGDPRYYHWGIRGDKASIAAFASMVRNNHVHGG